MILSCAFAMALLAVDTPMPRPEHPMPQMARAEWLNLNGEWDFAETDDDADASWLEATAYPDKITVPFCRESSLSGLSRKGFVRNVWYRRDFVKPTEWTSPRTRLHVGACDYRTEVWLNGHRLGEHEGGSAPFWFDATPWLRDDANTVIIHAFDDTRSGLQATGKQAHSEQSEGCVYTRVTGIWQTVWLEGVGGSFIEDVRMTPDVANNRLGLQVEVNGPCAGLTVAAEAFADGQSVCQDGTKADWRNARMELPIANPRLWTLEDPFLYTLRLTLLRDGKPVDTVDSYFGMREVSIQGAAILINGEAVFQRTVLDQGFYPDGIWTAPSDEALKHDIELSMAVGFNGARLHQKVFEPRFLYWADKMGYLLWGEYPNWGLNHELPGADAAVLKEWSELVRRDRNHPSIIGWCPFNESTTAAIPAQTAAVALTRVMDPTRPIIESSGWQHSLARPDVLDAHDYDQNPETFRQRWTDSFGPGLNLPDRYKTAQSWPGVPFFVSEYGGIGWAVKDGWGYGNAPETLEAFYTRFKGLTDALLDSRYMFGYCYTQLTDIEQEQNGLYTYDRQPKFDCAHLHAIQTREAAYEKSPPVDAVAPASPDWIVIVAGQPDGPLARDWRYTMETPAGEWNTPAFDDAQWSTGRAGFGDKGGWEKAILTSWKTPDIWLRQSFEMKDASTGAVALVIHYDNATEVYVNGAEVWKGENYNDAYSAFDITAAFRKAVKPGVNTIAAHCHQDTGGQFIDLAILEAKGDSKAITNNAFPADRLTDLTSIWEESPKRMLAGFHNLYNPCVVYEPGREWPFKMWFFGYAVQDVDPRWPGDVIFFARGKNMDAWQVYAGDAGWEANANAQAYVPVMRPAPAPWDGMANGDPMVVAKDGVYHMAFSSVGFDTRPDDKGAQHLYNISCVMGATSTDGVQWNRTARPIAMWDQEFTKPWEIIDGKIPPAPEGYQGSYHRPSILWDGGKWRLWFDYFLPGTFVSLGYAENTGDFMDPAAWRILRSGDAPLLRDWPNPVVFKVRDLYVTLADAPNFPAEMGGDGRQLALATSPDGIEWTVRGHVRPEGKASSHVPQALVMEQDGVEWLYIIYSWKPERKEGEEWDFRYKELRYIRCPVDRFLEAMSK